MQLANWADLDREAADWQALCDGCAASLFSTRTWVECWHSVHSPQAALLFSNYVASKLTAVAPMYVARWPFARGPWRFARLMGDGTNDAVDVQPAIAPGHEHGVAASLLGWVAQNPDVCDGIEFCSLADPSSFCRAVLAEATARGWGVARLDRPHLAMSLPDTWEEMEERLGSKLRLNLRRLMRLAEEHHPGLQRAETLEEALAHLSRMFVFGANYKSPLPQHRQMERLYRLFCTKLFELGKCDISILRLDGRPAAVKFGALHHDRYVAIQAAYDRRLSRWGPGALHERLIMERLMRDGVRHYDFLQGAQEYKLRWKPARSAYVNLLLAPPALSTKLALWAKQRAWRHGELAGSVARWLRT